MQPSPSSFWATRETTRTWMSGSGVALGVRSPAETNQRRIVANGRPLSSRHSTCRRGAVERPETLECAGGVPLPDKAVEGRLHAHRRHPIGNNPPEDVNVIIEVPVGGEPIKYEMDKEAGTLVVDRFLYTPMRYPGNYGFVPHTLSGDGDPSTCWSANTRGMPGCVIACARSAC
jgi:hypothetical protein